MVQLVLIKGSISIVMHVVAVLALNSHLFTILFDMLFELLERYFLKASTEALEVVTGTFTSFYMALKLSYGVDIKILLCHLALVTNFNIVNDLFENV